MRSDPDIPASWIEPHDRDLIAVDTETYQPEYSDPNAPPEEWAPAVIGVGYRPACESGHVRYFHDFSGGPAPSQVSTRAIDYIDTLPSDATLVTYNGKRFDVPMLRSWADIEPLVGREHLDLYRMVRDLNGQGWDWPSLEETLERHGCALDVETPENAGEIAYNIAHGGSARALKLLDYLRADVIRLPELADKLLRRYRQIDQAPLVDSVPSSHEWPQVRALADD
jgi:hypothetical protein